MYLILAITGIVCGTYQVVGADDENVYNYKVTEFYANLLTQMKQGVEDRTERLGRTMEQHCPFRKVADQYSAAIEMVENSPYRRICSPADHLTALETLTEGYQTSRKECLKKADCKSDLEETTAEVINTIQGFDSQASKDLSACTDDACKLKVQHKLQEDLLKLYQDSNPQLRLTSDKAIFNTKCYSSMVDCMIDNNTDRMKQMYAGIAKLQDCVSSQDLLRTGSKATVRHTWYSQE